MTDATLSSYDGDGYVEEHFPTSTGISNEKLGMWVFLASECLLFGGLISTFVLYRNKVLPSAPGEAAEHLHEVFNIPFTSASSFVLLMSSLTMVLAVSAAHRGDMPVTRTWLGVTALLGAVFISGQFYEFYEFVKIDGFGFTHSPAWSSFYALTGFHGGHVTVGIIMLMVTIGLTLKGRITQQNAEAVEVVGLYWHFVDIVWIVVFTIVYLIK